MIYTFSRPLPSTAPCFLCQTIYPVKVAVVKTGKHNQKKIASTILNYFELSENALHDKSRRADFVKCRFFIMLFLRELGMMTYPAIGEYLKKDHTSIIHGVVSVRRHIDIYDDYKKDYEALQMMLKS